MRIYMRNTIIAASLLIALLGAWSCKKDDSETTTPSLSGIVVSSDASTYMAIGSTITANCDVSNITSTTGEVPEPIGLAWQVNSEKRDTTSRDIRLSNPEFSVTLDEAGTYTITCYAFAESGYYSASSSVSFTIIDPATALTGLAGEPDTKIGDVTYRTMEAGGKTWMGENLYGTSVGRVYRDSEVVASVFGKYYTWEEAQTICPDGWHLPTADEFDTCLGTGSGALMVNASFIEVEMWTYWPEVSITNETLFNAIPTGYLDLTNESSPEQGFKEYAAFWTADQQDEFGLFRYIYDRNPIIQAGKGDKKTLAMSVRCVKD